MSWHVISRASRPVTREPEEPHPAAQHVIDTLSKNRLPPDADIAAIRRHYNLSRRAFLTELEPVESVFHIVPPDSAAPRLTIIRPKAFKAGMRLPALVYLHGGGWSLGSLATYEPLCRQLANATGQIIIWVEYRLAPESRYPAALDDTLAAWRWIQDHCEEWGVDRTRLSLGGDSAGGNLAAAAALTLRDENCAKPWRQVLLYPCLDMSASLASHRKFADGYLLTSSLYRWYRNNYVGSATDRDNWRMSPLFAEDFSGLPPTVLVYAGFDPLRDEAAAYAMKLALAQVPVEPLYFSDMIHGFLTMGGAIPTANLAVTRIAEALKALDNSRN